MKPALHFACLILALFIPLAAHAKHEPVNVDSILDVLDFEVTQRPIYRAAKFARIDSLKSLLNNANDLHLQHQLCNNLYHEYHKFQYDSAYSYAIKLRDVASLLGDNVERARAICKIAFCFTSVGFYKEASEVLNDFDTQNLPDDILENYYSQCIFLYQNLGYFVGSSSALFPNYNNLRLEYGVKKRHLAQSALLDVVNRTIEIEELPWQESINARKQFITDYNLSINDIAVQYSIIGEIYAAHNMNEHEIYYMALAAIHDIRGCVCETMAAQRLASLLVDRGELDRAVRYIKLAQDDANFYNSRFRKIEIGAALPLIEEMRTNHNERARTILIFIFSIVLITAIFLSCLLLGLKRKNKVLNEARNEIENKVQQLNDANNQLRIVNEKLNEANDIKDQYVVDSLYSDSEFVNNVELKCKAIARSVKAKQFSGIDDIIKSIGVKQERERLSSSFDSTFLKLFPNFIEEYNKLFPAEYQVTIAPDGTLPSEVRIFALMRLGIREPELVAKYLNLSLNTIYVYKAKVKSRAIHDKEDFDALIMRIPKL